MLNAATSRPGYPAYPREAGDRASRRQPALRERHGRLPSAAPRVIVHEPAAFHYPGAVATSGLLLRALNDTGDPPMRPLPDQVARLLQDLDAPPRLAAHLRAVHDVACQLTDWIAQRYPALPLVCDALLFKRLAEASGRSPWEEFLGFDDLLTSIGNDSGQRLAFQASYPLRHSR
jgi:hypothetical protein